MFTFIIDSRSLSISEIYVVFWFLIFLDSLYNVVLRQDTLQDIMLHDTYMTMAIGNTAINKQVIHA